MSQGEANHLQHAHEKLCDEEEVVEYDNHKAHSAGSSARLGANWRSGAWDSKGNVRVEYSIPEGLPLLRFDERRNDDELDDC